MNADNDADTRGRNTGDDGERQEGQPQVDQQHASQRHIPLQHLQHLRQHHLLHNHQQHQQQQQRQQQQQQQNGAHFQRPPNSEQMFAILPDGKLATVFRPQNSPITKLKINGAECDLITPDAARDYQRSLQLKERLNQATVTASVSAIDATSATVTWSLSGSSGGGVSVVIELGSQCQKKSKSKGKGKGKSDTKYVFEKVLESLSQREHTLQGLAPNTEYAIRTTLRLGELSAEASAPITFTTLPAPPSDLAPLDLAGMRDTHISLKWGKPKSRGGLPIKQYTVFSDMGDPEADVQSFSIVYTGTDTRCKVSGLSPSTVYRFSYLCENGAGRSSRTEIVTYRTSLGKPTEPDLPTLVSATSTEITLAWRAENPNVIASYEITFKDDSPAARYVHGYSGKEASCICSNLTPNTTYFFRLTATNIENRASNPTEPVAFTTAPARPNEPSQPSLVGKPNKSSFQVEWSPPPDAENLFQIGSFVVEIDEGQRTTPGKKTGASSGSYRICYEGAEKTCLVEDLKPGLLYHVRCACIGASGRSSFSAPTRISTAPDTPSPPSLRQAKAPTPHSLHIAWTGPAIDADGGARVSLFRVACYGPLPPTIATEGTSSVVQQLRHPADGEQTGDSAHTERESPTVSLPPQDLFRSHSESSPSPSSSTVPGEDSAPSDGGAPDPTGMGQSPITWRSVAKDTKATETFYLCGPAETYLFRAQCKNSAGWSSWSEPLVLTAKATCPEPPTNLKLSSPKPQSISLAFTPGFDNGCPVTKYRVYYKILDAQVDSSSPLDVTSSEANPPSSSTADIRKDTTSSPSPSPSAEWTVVSTKQPALRLQGMVPNTAYIFKVEAVNVAGTSRPSIESTIMTGATPPSPPSSLEVHDVTAHSARITWTAGTANGSPINSFILYTQDMERKLAYNVHEYTLVSLSPQTQYKVKVQAQNGIGLSQASETLTFKTLAVPPPAPKLEGHNTSHNTIKLKWRSSSSAKVIQTRLLYKQEGEELYRELFVGRSKTFKATKLAGETVFLFCAQDMNDAGWGALGEPISIATSESPVKPPALLALTHETEAFVIVRAEEQRGCKLELLGRLLPVLAFEETGDSLPAPKAHAHSTSADAIQPIQCDTDANQNSPVDEQSVSSTTEQPKSSASTIVSAEFTVTYREEGDDDNEEDEDTKAVVLTTTVDGDGSGDVSSMEACRVEFQSLCVAEEEGRFLVRWHHTNVTAPSVQASRVPTNEAALLELRARFVEVGSGDMSPLTPILRVKFGNQKHFALPSRQHQQQHQQNAEGASAGLRLRTMQGGNQFDTNGHSQSSPPSREPLVFVDASGAAKEAKRRALRDAKKKKEAQKAWITLMAILVPFVLIFLVLFLR